MTSAPESTDNTLRLKVGLEAVGLGKDSGDLIFVASLADGGVEVGQGLVLLGSSVA